MDHFAPASFQESPPYHPEEEDQTSFFPVPESDLKVWETLSLLTPPLTPVDTSNDKEVIRHLSSHQEPKTITDFPEELYSCTQDFNRTADSPAILNDIMWNAGQKHKRPDSAMDIDVRFCLSGTPSSFEQPITNTFIDTAELFSFSLFEQSVSHESQQEEQSKYSSTSFQEMSDSEEEIDVVSIQVETKQDIKQQNHTLNMHESKENTRKKAKGTFQKVKDKKEEVFSSDSDCEVTRISHNDLERKRRNELRSRFHHLRECIPSISNNEKAAKITILRKAYELIPVLKKEEKRLLIEKENERRRNVELLKKLSKLGAVLR